MPRQDTAGHSSRDSWHRWHRRDHEHPARLGSARVRPCRAPPNHTVIVKKVQLAGTPDRQDSGPVGPQGRSLPPPPTPRGQKGFRSCFEIVLGTVSSTPTPRHGARRPSKALRAPCALSNGCTTRQPREKGERGGGDRRPRRGQRGQESAETRQERVLCNVRLFGR